MASLFGNDAVAQIKARLNIVDVVQRYVQLKRNGHRWVAPCPFHHETKPSFSVNEEEGFFYCFGCQEKGDLITFYSKINGLEFKDALEQLAAEAGVELKNHRDPQAADAAKAERDRKRRCLAMHRLAAEQFQANIHSEAGTACRAYLERRGLDAATVEAFGLGYSLPSWQGLLDVLHEARYNSMEVVSGGLAKKNDKGNVYDLFRGRLMFPIQDAGGKVVAFGARLLEGDDGPKYINSSDTLIYKKGEHLYGLAQARRVIHQTKKALLTEGYLDVITLHQFGYHNALGALGTALTPEQIQRLGSYASQVELLFDGDGPGRKAAYKAARMLLLQGLGCRVTLLPQGEDADSLLKSGGVDALEAVRGHGQDGLDYCLATVRETTSPKEITQWAKDFIEALDDPAHHAYFLPRLLEGLGLEERAFRKALGEFVTSDEKKSRGLSVYKGGKNRRRDFKDESSFFIPTEGTPVSTISKEAELIRFALCFPETVAELHVEGAAILLHSAWAQHLWSVLCTVTENNDSMQVEALLEQLDSQQRAQYAEAMLQYDGFCSNRESILEELKQQIRCMHDADTVTQLKSQLDCHDSDVSFAALRKIQEIRERELSGRNDG